MAQCVQSVQEFIQDSFVPMVAVLCSEDAEKVTRKNNLNFPELLRPFCRLTSEGMNRHLLRGLQLCGTRWLDSDVSLPRFLKQCSYASEIADVSD